jgi:predicted DNA-binding helix-hairpin-helix protein
MAWAKQHLAGQPIEINRADRHMLLRIPGIGLKGVEVILKARKQGKIRDLSALKKMGVLTEKAAPFLLLDGRWPVYQLSLF